jgi:hypothetical protein
MSTTYAPVPTVLPATIDLPEDGVEAVVVESVNTNTAALADAVAAAMGSKNIARLELGTGNTASGATFVCTLDASYYRDDSWTLTSNTLEVPEAGLYMVFLQVPLNEAYPDVQDFAQIDVHVGGVFFGSVYGHLEAGGERTVVTGFVGPIPITGDLTTQRISIVNPVGNLKNISIGGASNAVFVTKLSSI